ncbi:MAG: ribonuclease HI family protein [Patescibacteria group bacterium]
MKTVRMYADGGSRGNPGKAAGAAVLFALNDDGTEGECIAEVVKYIGMNTNNQAEYTGIIIGLQKAKEFGYEFVDVRLDSELAVKQLNGEYRVRNPEIAKRFLEVHNLRTQFRSVKFTHVFREQNMHADSLVNASLDAA